MFNRSAKVALRLAFHSMPFDSRSNAFQAFDYSLRTFSLKMACLERSLRFAEGKRKLSRMERETGFEPATSTLARSHSTTELFPLVVNILL